MLVRLQGKEDISATMKTMPGSLKPDDPIVNFEVIARLVRITGEMTETEVASAVLLTSYIIKAASLGILEDVSL